MCGKKNLGISWKDRPKKFGPFGGSSFSSSQLPHVGDAKVTATACDAMMESTPCQGRVTISGDVYQINGKEVGSFFSGFHGL